MPRARTSVHPLAHVVITAALASCGAKPSGPADTPKDLSTATEVDPQPAPAAPRALVGKWMSLACGERTYPRTIDFAADATFHAEELISPCPQDVDCVWSGIIERDGTYVVADGRIALTDTSEASAAAKPLPATLEIDASSGAPVELAQGGTRCTYAP